MGSRKAPIAAPKSRKPAPPLEPLDASKTIVPLVQDPVERSFLEVQEIYRRGLLRRRRSRPPRSKKENLMREKVPGSADPSKTRGHRA